MDTDDGGVWLGYARGRRRPGERVRSSATEEERRAAGVRAAWASAWGGPVRVGRELEELGLGLLRPEEEEGREWIGPARRSGPTG